MPRVITKPDREQQAYTVKFHVRTSARPHADELQKKLEWSLGRMIGRLARQGWSFVRLSERPPRGPLPVVPIKGFPKRPPGGNAHTPLTKADDALWRVSTLPTFGPKAAHLMTDEVDWEYAAIFSRPAIATEYVKDEGDDPVWLKH
ncbi:MAG TPA: hypothetical protein VFB50_00355 [Chloroflexota bacterium]|nr:hypothetical protein [Chloroflexota bacterium]